MHPYTSAISRPNPQNRYVLGSDGDGISMIYCMYKRLAPFRSILRKIVRLLVYMEW